MENLYNNNSIISKKELTEPAELNNKLFIACKEGRLEDAKLLLGREADINAGWSHNNTPLGGACAEGDSEDVIRVLKMDARDVATADSYSESIPLHTACRKGSLDIIKLLLGYQANPHLKSMRGKTPLDILNAHPEINDEDKQNLIRRIEGKELSLVALCESVIIKELRENIKKGRSHSISSGLEALDLPTYTATQLFSGIFPKPKSALTDPSTENGLSNSVAP